MANERILLLLDNEGPQTLNDNAQETTVELASRCGLGEEVGTAFFKRVSNIDDIWGDFHRVPKDPGYSSGHTLKVILPFLKAMGATESSLTEFAAASLRVVPNIGEVLTRLQQKYTVWMISTSYEFFVYAFCKRTGFDPLRTHCTIVRDFDALPLGKIVAAELLAFMEEVARMPVIEYDTKTGMVIPDHKFHYDRVTWFVWDYLYGLPIGNLLRSVHPVGQTQKREAGERISRVSSIPLQRTMYVGDSQTDVQCVEWLHGKGLTMMFNGKGRVCGLADVMYIGESAQAIEQVADTFAERGRNVTLDYYRGSREADGGIVTTVTPENCSELEKASIAKRKAFRGIHIGELT